MYLKSLSAVLTFIYLILNINLAQATSHSIILGLGKQGISAKKKPIEGNEAKLEYRFASFYYNLQPHIGVMGSSKESAYVYAGLNYVIDFSPLHLGISFSPGIYHRGKGKKLGHPLEFKSQFEVYYDITRSVSLGASVSHRSNAGISKTNPGLNNIMLELQYRLN
ncbi:acyloxyacyl hydrolase [Candidatus Jidaibacter acanthamoebae]|nr:acyloxyacyl hydrolase [Candidatus Jidaibacter acanthamoeba]